MHGSPYTCYWQVILFSTQCSHSPTRSYLVLNPTVKFKWLKDHWTDGEQNAARKNVFNAVSFKLQSQTNWKRPKKRSRCWSTEKRQEIELTWLSAQRSRNRTWTDPLPVELSEPLLPVMPHVPKNQDLPNSARLHDLFLRLTFPHWHQLNHQ